MLTHAYFRSWTSWEPLAPQGAGLGNILMLGFAIVISVCTIMSALLLLVVVVVLLSIVI